MDPHSLVAEDALFLETFDLRLSSDMLTIMDKSSFIKRMFEDIAFSYDLQNSVLSLRRDVSWRKVLARSLRIPSEGVVLDLATGTTEIAVEICSQRPEAKVVGVDISSRMLEIGRKKIRSRRMEERIQLGLGDGRLLPFKDASFCAATHGFRSSQYR